MQVFLGLKEWTLGHGIRGLPTVAVGYESNSLLQGYDKQMIGKNGTVFGQ